MTGFWHAIEASDAVHRVGWALLHSVWLGSAAAGLLAAADGALRRRSANESGLGSGCACPARAWWAPCTAAGKSR